MAFIKNGKYAGQSFERIAAEDRRYCAWALREEREGGQLSRNLAGFVKFVKERHGGVMTIGKHRGLYRRAGSSPTWENVCSGNQETRKPGNQETRKTGNQETRKPGNQEIRKPGNRD